jgi:hypothetical protein
VSLVHFARDLFLLLLTYLAALAAQVMFDRTIKGLDIATGHQSITPTYETNGTAQATHTEPFVPLSTSL